MKELLKGRAWKFGHDLDRDAHIFPFQYVLESNGVPLERLAHHVMEPVNPAFGVKVRKGDFLVVGRNFGHGKGHPEGIACLKMLGIAAVIADSFINLFVKDAVYFGLPMLDGEGIYDRINQDDELEVDATASEIGDLSTGQVLKARLVIGEGHPLSPIMEAGGQVEYVRRKLARMRESGMSRSV